MELKKEQSNDNLKYDQLSIELQERIKDDRKQGKVNPYRCNDDMVIRRNMNHDKPNLWRPAFVRDIEKIIHLPYYNRSFACSACVKNCEKYRRGAWT